MFYPYAFHLIPFLLPPFPHSPPPHHRKGIQANVTSTCSVVQWEREPEAVQAEKVNGGWSEAHPDKYWEEVLKVLNNFGSSFWTTILEKRHCFFFYL